MICALCGMEKCTTNFKINKNENSCCNRIVNCSRSGNAIRYSDL